MTTNVTKYPPTTPEGRASMFRSMTNEELYSYTQKGFDQLDPLTQELADRLFTPKHQPKPLR